MNYGRLKNISNNLFCPLLPLAIICDLDRLSHKEVSRMMWCRRLKQNLYELCSSICNHKLDVKLSSDVRNLCITISWYMRNLSFTTSLVSSARVMSFDIQCSGGKIGSIIISELPFSPLISTEATLKLPPHWLQILLPRHFVSSISSLSLRLTTRSMSVTPSRISWDIEFHVKYSEE